MGFAFESRRNGFSEAASRHRRICASLTRRTLALLVLRSSPFSPIPQVQLKSVRLPDSHPISLDDQMCRFHVLMGTASSVMSTAAKVLCRNEKCVPHQRAYILTSRKCWTLCPVLAPKAYSYTIALKLSDDLHLNEVDCVRLLIKSCDDLLDLYQLLYPMGLNGKGTIGNFTAGSRTLAVVLDQGLRDDILVDIQKHLEDLISSGLRQRLLSLIKLNREETSGLGGSHCERYVVDSRGSLVERQAVVSRERLILGHCLVLSILVVRTGPKDIKDIFSVLKDSACEVGERNTTVKDQLTLFDILVNLNSRVLSMYDIKDEDFDGVVDQSRLSTTKESSPLKTQLPVLALLKVCAYSFLVLDFMSGKTAFQNIMSILLPGVNSVIAERSSQLYGHLLENAVQLALEIIILVLHKDLLLFYYWRPLYQPAAVLHIHQNIVAKSAPLLTARHVFLIWQSVYT
ncbi:hypothetical protein VNO78_02626 [Psophocarpus tetragonolobus]|uniref:Uncharacterized protein n=1 Tax=Psophocarpus tetragonolobus TaxID=3891 RepID=A0AAN9XW62_PSOTE